MNTSEETDKQPIEEEVAKAESTEAEPTEAQKEPIAEAVEPAAQSTSKPGSEQTKKGPRTKPRAKKGNPTVKQVSDRFAACGRCSFLWAGYRVIFGEEGQETAVVNNRSGWMDLEWNTQMPDLLFKSYGIRLDISFYHYEGCCKECRRRFVYQAPDKPEDAVQCAIEISPNSAK
ncbi:hypothetical protein [Candidatus Leptofilum sp.]|uniref:hypothetical protein n=1 Tax=Candidatus Leptofilum sp. TaxID=3241576 RepID=UPI003B5B9656